MEKIKLNENMFELKKIKSKNNLEEELLKNKIIKLDFDERNNNLNMSIILVLILKNKEKNIINILNSVYKFINYWIISDIGSTDNTAKIVLNFFKEKKISGELYFDIWENYEKNGTILFNRCYNKGDFILFLENDEILNENLDLNELNNIFNKNCKNNIIKFKINYKKFSQNNNIFYFKKYNLFNANYKWKFCGVLYSKIKVLNIENKENEENENKENEKYNIDFTNNTNFYIINNEINENINKYYNDALLLREQFFNTLIYDKEQLNSITLFYIAQSYRNANKIEQALQYYNLYVKLNNASTEELFDSYMNLARLYNLIKNNENNYEKIIENYEKAINVLEDRAEPYYELGLFFNKYNNYEKSYKLFKIAKLKNLENVKNKYNLLINEKCYNIFINDELSISCYYLKKYEEGYNYLLEIIDHNKFINERNRLLKNLNFFKEKLVI